ncbi:MAG: hypothetical protein ACTS6A_01260 [Candidatus Hodgkinia cicadicola]
MKERENGKKVERSRGREESANGGSHLGERTDWVWAPRCSFEEIYELNRAVRR